MYSLRVIFKENMNQQPFGLSKHKVQPMVCPLVHLGYNGIDKTVHGTLEEDIYNSVSLQNEHYTEHVGSTGMNNNKPPINANNVKSKSPMVSDFFVSLPIHVYILLILRFCSRGTMSKPMNHTHMKTFTTKNWMKQILT